MEESKVVNQNVVIRSVNEVVCSRNSIIGDALEWAMGEAKHCWCCTAVRTFLITTIFWVALYILFG